MTSFQVDVLCKCRTLSEKDKKKCECGISLSDHLAKLVVVCIFFIFAIIQFLNYCCTLFSIGRAMQCFSVLQKHCFPCYGSEVFKRNRWINGKNLYFRIYMFFIAVL